MIVRKFVVLVWCLAGYFTTLNGLYLNYAAPKNKALEGLQNNADDYSSRNIDKWFRKGRHKYKKLIILDRKNKRVDDFVKKLMTVIEMNERDMLLNEDKRKMNCRHVSFGSIFNAKAKRKRCKELHTVYKRKQPRINFVIPIPVKKKNIFADATREGFADDYLLDFDRKYIDFDYFNTVHRALDTKNKQNNKAIEKKETNTLPKIIAKNNRQSLDTPKSLRKDHTRFRIVPNKYNSVETYGKRNKNKNPIRSDNSDSDSIDDTDNTDDDKNRNSKKTDSNSDVDTNNKPIKSKISKIKKIKDEWNDILNMPDTAPDSSEESSPLKNEKKRGKKTYESNSSENEDYDSDASQQDFKPHNNNYKDGSYNEKYVYMQGHRLYDVKNNQDSRRMRIKDYFLPKRSYWSENNIKHLGTYWNSHENSRNSR